MKSKELSEEHDELQILHDIAVQLNGAVDLQNALEIAYKTAIKEQYQWHEFGDLHLML